MNAETERSGCFQTLGKDFNTEQWCECTKVEFKGFFFLTPIDF